MDKSVKLKKNHLIKLVAIAKDEGPYIPQWVFHHVNLGIDLIEIHINNTTDNSLDICKKISKTMSGFTYFTSEKLLRKCKEQGKKFQLAAYNKSLRRSRQGADNATHILFLDLDEYLICRSAGEKISQLIDSSPGVDVFSFLWYFENWDKKKKAFSNPITDNTIGIRNNHVKSLIKISKKIKSCEHHNAVFRDGITPKNLLSDTLIPLSDTNNTRLNRSLVNNSLIHALGKDKTEGWFVLHCVYRSETEYLASLVRARAHNNHPAPIKDNRWGLQNPNGQALNLNTNKGKLQYNLNLFAFLTKNKLFNELSIARRHLIRRREALDELLSQQPNLLSDYKKVFQGTVYSK